MQSEAKKYAVVFIGEQGRCLMLARSLDAENAAERAKAEARRLRVGRMFAAGSEPQANTVLVVPDEV